MRVFETEWIDDYIKRHELQCKLHECVVDIGCGDGVHQSNSVFFIKTHQWRALLVDGLSKNIAACRNLYANTPQVQCVTAILSDLIEEVCFEENPWHWSLSAMDYAKPVNAKTKLLSSILKEKEINQVGLMSIDVEGYEHKILNDLLANNIYPQILIVEANELCQMQRHREILADKYKLVGGILPNQFFVLKCLLRK